MLVDPDTQAGLATEPATPENGAPDEPGADDDEYTILVPTTDMSTAGRLIQIAAALMSVLITKFFMLRMVTGPDGCAEALRSGVVEWARTGRGAEPR